MTRTSSPIISIASGRLRGISQDGVNSYLGVPYAAPPVGSLRFAAPGPVQPWTGVRTATDPGPNAPHRTASMPRIDLVPIIGGGWVRGDDYLTLDIRSPVGATGLPVMVWVHGGGLVLGSKDVAVQNGTRLARAGVVSVAINYRLGTEGFAPIPGAATNLGLRDVIAALLWVRDNIAAFGGDPSRVTIFGESGGAMAVSCLVASPLARGLVQRAIVQSGHGSSVVSLEVGRRVVHALAERLKVAPTIEGFLSRTWDQVLDAQAAIARPGGVDLRDAQGFDPGFGLGRFNPVFGDDVLPEPPLAALASGRGREVDLLIGTTTEEADLWFTPLWLDRLLPGFAARWLLGKAIPRPREALAAYGVGHGKRPGRALADALTDLAFRWPAHQFATTHQGSAHVYTFDWRSPTARIGACHGMDLPFVFDTLDTVTGPRGVAGRHPPRELAAKIQGIWVEFARSGSVPWPAFDGADRQVHALFSGVTSRATLPPAAAFSAGLNPLPTEAQE